MLGPVDWEPRVSHCTVSPSYFHLGREIILQACGAAVLSFPFSSFKLFNITIRTYLWFPSTRSCHSDDVGGEPTNPRQRGEALVSKLKEAHEWAQAAMAMAQQTQEE